MTVDIITNFTYEIEIKIAVKLIIKMNFLHKNPINILIYVTFYSR
jgi:hypothetical protein